MTNEDDLKTGIDNSIQKYTNTLSPLQLFRRLLTFMHYDMNALHAISGYIGLPVHIG